MTTDHFATGALFSFWVSLKNTFLCKQSYMASPISSHYKIQFQVLVRITAEAGVFQSPGGFLAYLVLVKPLYLVAHRPVNISGASLSTIFKILFCK
jgi:hypothetical protein